MKIKFLIIAIVVFVFYFPTFAVKYQIKALNSSSISIDGKKLKIGDWFSDTSSISWSAENQAMKVVSDANKVYTISAKTYNKAKAKKFGDFLSYSKSLAARGYAPTLGLELSELLGSNPFFLMLDEIQISTEDIVLPVSVKLFLISKGKSKDRINIIHDENNIIIPRSLIAPLYLSENELDFTLYLIDEGENDAEEVVDNLKIEILPENIE